jgi:WD40 repeat protein
MSGFNNENILKLIFTSFAYSKCKQLYNDSSNKTIMHNILSCCDFDKIYKSIGRSKTNLFEHTRSISSMILLPNGNIFALSVDGIFKEWDNDICIRTLKADNRIYSSLALLPDGVIASGDLEGNIIIWTDAGDSFIEVKIIKETNYWNFDNLLLLSKGNLAFTAANSFSYRIIILDGSAMNYRILKRLNVHLGWITCLVNISNDKFASSSFDKTIKIWNSIDYDCVKTLEGHEDEVLSLLCIDKGDLLISGSYGRIKVWDLKSFQCIRTILTDGGGIKCLILLPNGYFASGSIGMDENTIIQIWNMSNYQCIKSLKGHNKGITSIKLLSDCRLVTSSYDGTVILWD